MANTVNRGYRVPAPAGTVEVPDIRAAVRNLGADVDLDVAGLATGYRLLTVVRFTSNGAFTKANYSGIRAINLAGCGGGGGSAGAAATGAAQKALGGPGGGAAYAMSFLILASALGATENVTIGAAGAAGAVGADGGPGGTTQFGTSTPFIKAPGGAQGLSTGTFANTGATGFTLGGGGGSSASGAGDLVIDGNDAPAVAWYNSEIDYAELAGAASAGPYGSITMPTGLAGSFAGRAGRGFGSGAAGSYNNISQSARAGAAGTPGLCVVEVYV